MGEARAAVARRTGPVELPAGQDAVHAVVRPPHPLTAVEVNVLQWVAWGKRYHEIALILETSVWMVQNHVNHILDKIGASTRASAVRWGMQNGVIS